MRFHGVTKRGTLAFGEVTFTTRPRLYELTPQEAARLRDLYRNRLYLEPLGPDTAGEAEQNRPVKLERRNPGFMGL